MTMSYSAIERLKAEIDQVAGRWLAEHEEWDITVNLKCEQLSGEVVRITVKPQPRPPTLPGFGADEDQGFAYPVRHADETREGVLR